MQLIELQIEHFRQYQSATIRFDTGITAIVGANGAGKTTLIEAITWALYGADAKRGDNSTLMPLWSSGGVRPRVTLTFELGGNRYQVIRTSNSANFHLHRDGQLQMLASSLSAVTQKSEELLGMNLRQFQTSFCARQKELEFMAYEKEKRREEISRMLGYERLSTGIDDAKADANALRKEVEGLEIGLGDPAQLQQQLKTLKQQIEEAEDALEEAQKTEQEAYQALREIEPLKQAAEANRQTYQTLEKQKALLEAQHSNLRQQLDQATQRLEEMRKAHARFKEIKPRVDTYKESLDRQKELDELVPYEQKRVRLQTESANCRNLIEQAESRLKELRQKEERLQSLATGLQTYDRLKSQLQTLRENAQKAQQRTRIETTIREQEKQYVKLKEQIQASGNPKAELQKLQQSLAKARPSLQAQEQQREQIRETWNHHKADLNAKIRNLQAEIKQLRQKQDDLQALGVEGECPTCKQPLGSLFQQVLSEQETLVQDKQALLLQLQSELDTLSAEPQELPELQAAITQAQQKIREMEQLEAKLEMRQAQLSEWQTQTAEAERQIESLRSQVTSLPHYDPQEEAQITEQMKTLEPLVKETNTLQVELRQKPQLETELKQHRQTLTQTEHQIQTLPAGYDAQEHEQMRRLVKDNLSYYEEALTIKATLQEKDSVSESKNQLQTDLQQNERDLQETLQSIQNLHFSEEEHQRLMMAYEGARTKWYDTQSIRREQEAELKQFQELHKGLQTQYEEYQRKQKLLREKQQELILGNTLVKTLQDFRTALNTQLRPTLAEYAGEFLSRVTGGRYSQLEIDEQYNFTLRDDDALKTVISGGESDVVNLCLRLGLARLITERAGLPLSLLILDEVFGSLDAERRQNVLEVLRELRTWFQQILVISHIEDINEAADRCLWIRRDEQTRSSVVRENQEEDEMNLQALVAVAASDVQGELFTNT
jgi:exonuclease SbcC